MALHLVNKESKPPYDVPSMEEVAKVRGTANRTVVSTFSGCGGGCLGFEMAGFGVLVASEFIPAAAEVYRLNHPGVHLDTNDIRSITPQEFLGSLWAPGEIDILEGSPPCASFSTAGNREKDWGKKKKYSETTQQTDDLFFEYARMVKGIQPKVFVAENVSGIVKGKAKGYFKEIMKALRKCGYKVTAQMLDAQWLGVPQMRKRVIIIGVRNDLPFEPEACFPKPFKYRYSVQDACPWIRRGKFGGAGWQTARQPSPTVSAQVCYNAATSKQGLELIEVDTPSSEGTAVGTEWDRLKPGEQSQKYFQLIRQHPLAPANTITAAGGQKGIASVMHPFEKRKFTIAELKRICSFPDDFVLKGTYEQQWERLGRSVPPLMMKAVAKSILIQLRRHNV